MATFYEVKQLLCRLFGHRDIEDNDDDIEVNAKIDKLLFPMQNYLNSIIKFLLWITMV